MTYCALPGELYHLYHNDYRNRQYGSRYFILDKYLQSTAIDDIIYKNKDGVYEWIDEIKDHINKDVLEYFASRRDDEV